MIVTGDRVLAFVTAQTGSRIFLPYTAIGREVGGRVVAGIVFNCWTYTDIELTVASLPGGITRRLMRRAAYYVFKEAGCIRASFTTENQKVIDLALRLGAQTEGRKRHLYGRGRDGVILGILREDWTLG